LKKVTVFLTVFLLALAIVGCSNETKEKNDKKEVISTLQEIKQRGKVIVGTEAAYAPFEFVEDGKIVGYGSDILAEVVKNLGVELDQKDIPFSGLFPNLEEKKIDFIATAVSVKPERKEKYSFTMPIADVSLILVKNKNNSDINSIDDIEGKNVGCNLGSAPEKELKKYNEKLKAEGKQEVTIKTYNSYPEMLLDLKNERIDVALGDHSVINYSIKDQKDVYEVVAPFTFTEKVYLSWVTRKDDKELLEFLNAEILKLKKNGKLAELQQKWFGTTWDLPDSI